MLQFPHMEARANSTNIAIGFAGHMPSKTFLAPSSLTSIFTTLKLFTNLRTAHAFFSINY